MEEERVGKKGRTERFKRENNSSDISWEEKGESSQTNISQVKIVVTMMVMKKKKKANIFLLSP